MRAENVDEGSRSSPGSVIRPIRGGGRRPILEAFSQAGEHLAGPHLRWLKLSTAPGECLPEYGSGGSADQACPSRWVRENGIVGTLPVKVMGPCLQLLRAGAVSPG